MAQNADAELMQACVIVNDGGLGRACRAVAAGADVGHLAAEGFSPLFAAALAGSVRTCEMLIRRGAAVTLPLGNGLVALHVACHGSRLEVARLLVARGADVGIADGDGVTPLHYACKAGSAELADFLLSKGADPCCADGDGRTPLYLACQHGHKVRGTSRGVGPSQKLRSTSSMALSIASIYHAHSACRPCLCVDRTSPSHWTSFARAVLLLPLSSFLTRRWLSCRWPEALTPAAPATRA